MSEVCVPESTRRLTMTTRCQVESILAQQDDRLLVIVRPRLAQGSAKILKLCHRLQRLGQNSCNDVMMVLQVNPENVCASVNGGSPRYTNQPVGYMTNEQGSTTSGIPVAAEIRGTILVHYVPDLLSLGLAAGCEVQSQSLRELVSGLPFPIGLRNNSGVPIDAIKSSAEQHQCFGITKLGQLAVISTAGNAHAFTVLPGNSDLIDQTLPQIRKGGGELQQTSSWRSIVIDCSYETPTDIPRNAAVLAHVAALLQNGETSLTGIVVEADITGERRTSNIGTDWASVEATIEELSACVRARRAIVKARKDAGHCYC
ncbi:uncharacterized protein F5Z01DRAFT_695669 [Emericellopsis atlantica]|uniref:3-deoxy-7-phosphoheptulonate synthase n=1 Tax=Emericellopsis atlantica TaxID=2614577 RepID=A0A9P8CK94_9HYPO|nr:uncharacterized protein F5Z01DRAFT_695669 [Emericellopsis atlantica]KAG9250123.1 hypothetical protein F5Z01DRAFT_695669 [Emericellopsis atlantica]